MSRVCACDGARARTNSIRLRRRTLILYTNEAVAVFLRLLLLLRRLVRYVGRRRSRGKTRRDGSETRFCGGDGQSPKTTVMINITCARRPKHLINSGQRNKNVPVVILFHTHTQTHTHTQQQQQ